MGVQKPQIRITADPALLLDAASADRVEGLLRTHGIDPHGSYALFVLRPWEALDRVLPDLTQTAQKL